MLALHFKEGEQVKAGDLLAEIDPSQFQVALAQAQGQQARVNDSLGTLKAAVASAQLQLNWSRITAPVSGRTGLKQVDIGNQISSGDTNGIVVITQTHPVDVLFTLPESDIPDIMEARKSGTLSVEA